MSQAKCCFRFISIFLDKSVDVLISLENLLKSFSVLFRFLCLCVSDRKNTCLVSFISDDLGPLHNATVEQLNWTALNIWLLPTIPPTRPQLVTQQQQCLPRSTNGIGGHSSSSTTYLYCFSCPHYILCRFVSIPSNKPGRCIVIQQSKDGYRTTGL